MMINGRLAPETWCRLWEKNLVGYPGSNPWHRTYWNIRSNHSTAIGYCILTYVCHFICIKYLYAYCNLLTWHNNIIKPNFTIVALYSNMPTLRNKYLMTNGYGVCTQFPRYVKRFEIIPRKRVLSKSCMYGVEGLTALETIDKRVFFFSRSRSSRLCRYPFQTQQL